jgi:pyruvate dehydrogenase E1 component
MYYKEDKQGQILEEGITEAGAFSAWLAAATSYSNHHYPMIPFYIFYSMFGFQRIMDLAWAAGDSQARGFLLGATAGRTTLNGEGLQHQDGHSHLMANMIPNCVSYDPTYSHELAVIIQDGMRRMYQDKENVFYYVTVMNENYAHPDMPEGSAEGIIKGLYCLAPSAAKKPKLKVQLMGSGTILREVEAAAEILKAEYKVEADVWSATSINLLRRDGLDCERWNMLHPESEAKVPYVTEQFRGRQGPVICATDYIKSYGEQLRPYIESPYVVLGTDGYGRSDTRAKLRAHFEVDRYYIVVAALKALADDGQVALSDVSKAIKAFGIDTEKANPLYR